MMLLPFLIVAFLPSSPLQEQRSNYQQAILHPDPFNGYDDYVRATDVLRGPELGVYLSWNPKQYEEMLDAKKAGNTEESKGMLPVPSEFQLDLARQLHGLDYLGEQRAMVGRFGGALALMRAGNQKRVWDPREKMDAATIFPEYAGFKSVAKVLVADAYVKFADGDGRGATADLLEGLTFSRRFGGGILIAQLVSVACQAITLAAFEAHLSRLSVRDAKQIASYVDGALAESNTYIEALQRERDMALTNVDLALTAPLNFWDSTQGGSDAEKALEKFVAGMSPSEKTDVKANLVRSINATFDRIIGRLGKDESSWADKHEDDLPPEPTTVTTTQEAADVIMNRLLPVYDQATIAVLKGRTQLRLLGLHARIIDFKWRHNRLPTELKEVASEKLIYDPMGKGPFQYELRDGGYKLYSKGLPATGPIELRYRRPANLPGADDGPIPPLRGRLEVILAHASALRIAPFAAGAALKC